jgi:hypothetical protein
MSGLPHRYVTEPADHLEGPFVYLAEPASAVRGVGKRERGSMSEELSSGVDLVCR